MNTQNENMQPKTSPIKKLVSGCQLILLITVIALFAWDFLAPEEAKSETITQEEYNEMVFENVHGIAGEAVNQSYHQNFTFQNYKSGDVEFVATVTDDLGMGTYTYNVYYCSLYTTDGTMYYLKVSSCDDQTNPHTQSMVLYYE